MARSAQVLKLSHRHEAIMNFMLENPEVSKGDIAAHFGVTPAWLSVVINSDAFQHELRQRQDAIFGDTRLSIRDKMTGLADRAAERLLEEVDNMSIRDLQSSADLALKAIGLGARRESFGSVHVTQINMGSVSPEQLAEARSRIGAPALEASVVAEQE